MWHGHEFKHSQQIFDRFDRPQEIRSNLISYFVRILGRIRALSDKNSHKRQRVRESETEILVPDEM
jgi:hypothetical protein